MAAERVDSPVPGYHGHYLRIDLSSGGSEQVPLAEDVLRRFIGGSGLGAYIMLREDAAVADPLSPDAPLAFVFSPLVGSPLTTSAKFAVVCRGPLTGRYNDSLVSSHFALAGKRTGHDAVVLVGRARRLSLLIVDDDRVRLERADNLAGMSGAAAESAVRGRLGGDYAVAAIGPAGERRVRFATISHDGRHAGRGGTGAVLGAANIKAVALRGTRRCGPARPEQVIKLAKDLSRRSFGPETAKYRELGTVANLPVFNRLAVLPTRNFQAGRFDGAVALAPEQLASTREKTRKSCAACTIGCEHIYSLNGRGGVRMEYENLFALGPLCGIDDAEAILRASQKCDELGIDTISAGGTIAFAMECAERGMLDAGWLRFGDAEALHRAIDEIAARRGLGDELAEGSRRLANEIGGNALQFAPQVKGLEIPGYEPRGLQTMALGFAVGSRGADHNRSGAYEADFSAAVDRRCGSAESALPAIDLEDRAAVLDSLILCRFLRGVFDDFFGELATMLSAVTGWNMSAGELRQTAQRIVAARKLVNIRCGWQPAEDTLPDRFLTQPLPDDPQARLNHNQLAEMVRTYNLARGWTEEGWIGPAALRGLQLDDL